jgi:drug/metabolite transporter (DMT)-like permease
MSSGQSGPPPVRKHLMTPGQPRPQRREPMSLGTVQRWVLSTLAATTIMHLAVGVVLAAYFSSTLDAKIGLLVISAAFGLIAIVAALLIHRHRPVSWWLLLGLVPALFGAYLIFG